MEQGKSFLLPWQEEVAQRALQLKEQQHLPHAVLVDTCSEHGIDHLASNLSALLLCDSPENLSACGNCEACRMMSAGTYADFSMVTLEHDSKTKKINKNIKIDQVRNLIHEVSLTRKYQRLKIAAIYPAETMNKSSANALLKTLEEPAPQVLLLLLTPNRGRIPVTLRSRCQTWTIKPPTTSLALEWLGKEGIDATTATQYLQFACGDPLLALHLQQQDYAGLVDKFKTRLVTFLRGSLSASELSKGLLSGEAAITRRLVEMTLNAYCYQSSGVDGDANAIAGEDRGRARQLLDLRQRASYQLQVEENNLDFQLQLEDVLISLKQILTRRLI
jgi:DNA polymerase-3 subunit delta'